MKNRIIKKINKHETIYILLAYIITYIFRLFFYNKKLIANYVLRTGYYRWTDTPRWFHKLILTYQTETYTSIEKKRENGVQDFSPTKTIAANSFLVFHGQ